MTTANEVLKRRVAEGVLAFPVTPFTAAGALDPGCFADHIDFLKGYRPTAILPAGGAGELFSLSPEEHKRLVDIAVARAGDIPVIAGAGQGIAIATAMARAAEAGGRRRHPPLSALSRRRRAGRARGLCRERLPGGVDRRHRL